VATLSAHLRQTEGHARLPFHPDCPVCRSERLSGELPSDSLVSRRSQAAIAAGLLAFSNVAPGAMAAESDQNTEGTAAPGQVIGGGGSESPDFDPGGESADLPVEVPPAPQVPAPADIGESEPLEPEPVIDEAPVAERGGEATTVGEEPLPTAPVEEPVAAHAPEAPAQPEMTTSAVNKPSGARSDGTARRSAPRPVARTVTRRPASVPAHAVAPAHATSPTSAVAAPTRVAATPPPRRAPTPTVVVSGTQTGRSQPGDRFHIVRPGESLWSIAADVLGDDATVARIAREVNRLWQLNEERIATGDRNLLLVGTRLRLT
jgi:hypothetical protein